MSFLPHPMSPSQLDAFVKRRLEDIRKKGGAEKEKYYKRFGEYKDFRDELTLLCNYVNTRYRDSEILVHYEPGYEWFDAKITDTQHPSSIIEYIQLTLTDDQADQAQLDSFFAEACRDDLTDSERTKNIEDTIKFQNDRGVWFDEDSAAIRILRPVAISAARKYTNDYSHTIRSVLVIGIEVAAPPS
jgi:hypothetical protein